MYFIILWLLRDNSIFYYICCMVKLYKKKILTCYVISSIESERSLIYYICFDMSSLEMDPYYLCVTWNKIVIIKDLKQIIYEGWSEYYICNIFLFGRKPVERPNSLSIGASSSLLFSLPAYKLSMDGQISPLATPLASASPGLTFEPLTQKFKEKTGISGLDTA